MLVVAAVGLVVIGSIALFVVGVLDHRPQRWGLACAGLAAGLYVVYFGDVLLPGEPSFARDIVEPLGVFGRVDSDFDSSVGIALALIPIYAMQAAIFFRVTADTAVGHLSDRIVNFVSGVTAAVLLGVIVVSALHGGYVLAGGYAACVVLVWAYAASSKSMRALPRAVGRNVLLSMMGATSIFVVGCARLVAAIISSGDRLSVWLADSTSRLQGANERKRDELTRRRQIENAALVLRRKPATDDLAGPSAGPASEPLA